YLDTRITWLSEQSALWSGEDYIFVTDTKTYGGGIYDQTTLLDRINDFIQQIRDFFAKIINFILGLFS
ncbi:MAG: hypothetical protein LUG85_05885, partial [Clostridiales bacterium]|nr:hypothetical protein [Clostridiales bacterium]